MMATNVGDYYSTDEKVVGVWTDGRPIYQISISGNLGNSSGQGSNGDLFVPLPTGTNSDLQISFQGYVYNKTSSGSIGISPCHTYVSGIGHISGNLVPSWSATNSDTVLIRNSMSAFNGWPFIATIRYTKTTDAASSSLTTPGCYDITRPDLWPAGQEIFFGNGLYGKRFVGTFTTANIWTDYLVQLDTIDRGKTLKIINRGGGIGRRNGDTYMPLGMQDTLEYDVWYASGLSGQTAGFRLRGKDNGTHSCSYDIWVIYTK